MTYAIFHKYHNEFFIGFDINSEPAWGKKALARVWDNKLHAECQALLLAQDDSDVQREAVSLPKSPNKP